MDHKLFDALPPLTVVRFTPEIQPDNCNHLCDSPLGLLGTLTGHVWRDGVQRLVSFHEPFSCGHRGRQYAGAAGEWILAESTGWWCAACDVEVVDEH